MILFQVKAKHPPVISEGLNLSPCPTPWPGLTHVAAAAASSHRTPRHTIGRLTAHQKGRANAPVFNKISEQHRRLPQSNSEDQSSTTIRFRWLASHQLSQIDFYFISIPPHGSGAFPGASVVSSFLSSSLRPLFVRLVNARSWFYFPFAGPPAIPMVGAPGNTPEPAHTMNSGDFYKTYPR